MRITLDTNVLVSAFIARHGHSADLLELSLTVESLELVLSDGILEEFENVLMRDDVRRRFAYTKQDIKKTVATLRNLSKLVSPKSKFHVVRDDPKDNVILNCAHDGDADYIVSGDSHLLKLEKFRDIKIVNPKQMMDIISREFPELVFHF